MTKFTQEQIYNFLCREFPEKFTNLLHLPRPVKHPGDQPKMPQKTFSFNFEISKNDSIASIFERVELLKEEVGSHVSIVNGNLTFLGPGMIHCDDDDYDDYEDGNYEDDDGDSYISLSPPAYSSARTLASNNQPTDLINFHISYQDSSYHQKLDEYERDMKLWSQNLRQYQERKVLIKETEKINEKTIHEARNRNIELWKQAGRHLANRDSSAWLQVRAQYFRDKLSEIEGRLNTLPPSEGRN